MPGGAVSLSSRQRLARRAALVRHLQVPDHLRDLLVDAAYCAVERVFEVALCALEVDLVVSWRATCWIRVWLVRGASS